ncbi:MAG: DUF3916 domain-containing protein [Hyphomicrobiales bacterium]|nr:MAG: DUF3916 domain-containing protein [Hyphomicrobiales bacterium]
MAKPVARLALPGKRRRLRKPETHLAAIDAWADGFRGVWPEAADDRSHVHWHLPADQRLVDPPWAAEPHQARALGALLSVAAHLRAARPPEHARQIVYVVLHWPTLFMAEVGVFLDPDYAAGFEMRSATSQTWTPLPEGSSLLQRLGVTCPAGFVEHGYRERYDNGDDVTESEVWVIREPLPTPGA